jgi:intracellular sulfur oxidation DsrE/DsrF family protein
MAWNRVWIVTILVVAFRLPYASAEEVSGLQIEVPVTLSEAKVVFNLDHPVFSGDEPIGLQFLRVMVERFRADHTNAQIIAIFHGGAGYMGLGDAAYDRVRNWSHGNPYKDQILALQQAGVRFEECGETMQMNHWGNADLLDGIKPNTAANYRIIQLVQQGFVQLQP